MRFFILMVGLVGSGKSTKAKQLKESIYMSSPKYDEFGRADITTYISSDDIRAEFGDVNDQSQNEKVFKEVHNRIKEATQRYEHIIVDATNLTIKSRKSILNCIKNVNGYYKQAYVMTTPLSVCKERNANRERVVPEFVIDNMIRKFEIPFYEEGFDEIVLDNWNFNTMSHWGSDNEVDKNITTLMDGFNQRNTHHLYDLGTHCRNVHEELKKRSDNPMLIRSALVHDIGKLYTGEPKEDGSGNWGYKQHHNYGTYTLLQNIDCLCIPEIEKVLEILFYVNYHMQPFFIQSEKSEKKWKEIFGEEKYNNLLIFNECDKIGSGTHRD